MIPTDAAARLARRRKELWAVVLRAKRLCVDSDRLCRRSRWETRRARRLLEQRVLRGVLTHPVRRARRPRRAAASTGLHAVP
jgi:hypothetical protein